eukprot:1153150-Pelagomonas_calceolata.AAC.3
MEAKLGTTLPAPASFHTLLYDKASIMGSQDSAEARETRQGERRKPLLQGDSDQPGCETAAQLITA